MVDIARPESVKRKKKIRRIIYGVVAVLAVAGISFGVSRLSPAAPGVEKATVVTLYLLPTMMSDVEAKLRKELKPGTRVISHDYPLPTWKPVEVDKFDSQEKIPISGTTRTVLLLYRVP